jgi:hypothetical protein
VNGSAEEDSVVTTEEITRLRSELDVARADNARLSICFAPVADLR